MLHLVDFDDFASCSYQIPQRINQLPPIIDTALDKIETSANLITISEIQISEKVDAVML